MSALPFRYFVIIQREVLPELRTILGRGTQYDWQIKELPDGGMSNYIVPVESWVKVAGQVIQTNLQVKNK
jgi:hypothetical protein